MGIAVTGSAIAVYALAGFANSRTQFFIYDETASEFSYWNVFYTVHTIVLSTLEIVDQSRVQISSICAPIR